jgi:predicted histone-like DNA-binding protein
MAKYIKKEMTDLNGKGAPQAYYRLKAWRMLESDEFIKRCHQLNGAFSESVIHGVVAALTHHLAYELANGFTVKIDGLGVFSTKIGMCKNKKQDEFDEDEAKHNARSLQVTGVSLKVDKALVKAINRDCDLERGGEERLRVRKFTYEQSVSRARDYLRQHGFMRVGDYVRLNGLSYSTASRELIRIANSPDSGIVSQGSKSAKLYLLAPGTSSY